MSDKTMREALESLRQKFSSGNDVPVQDARITRAEFEALASAQPDGPGVTLLPDGSAFFTLSYPLPADHWLYAPREYAEGAVEPKELPRPLLDHSVRDVVEQAIRYAVRGATMCGKESDFDPDALVQNAVYALCGPFTGRALLATPAPDCGRCNGSGESTGTAGAGPDTYDVDIPCPDCKGTGDAAPSQREKVGAEYRRGFTDGYNQRDAEVRGALV